MGVEERFRSGGELLDVGSVVCFYGTFDVGFVLEEDLIFGFGGC